MKIMKPAPLPMSERGNLWSALNQVPAISEVSPNFPLWGMFSQPPVIEVVSDLEEHEESFPSYNSLG